MIKHLQIGMHCLEGTEWMSEGLGKMWGSGGMRLVHMSTDPRIEICNKKRSRFLGWSQVINIRALKMNSQKLFVTRIGSFVTSL